MKTKFTMLLALAICLHLVAEEKIDLKAGLLAHWTFEESTGNIAKDASGNNIDAKLTEGATHCEGKFGRGVQCDGIKGSVRIPRNPKLESTNGTTVALWAFIEAPARDTFHDLMRHEKGPEGACLRWKHGSQILQFRVDRKNKEGVYAVDNISNERYLNAWHHFAGTFDPKTGTGRLYVDGELHSEARGEPGPLEYSGGDIGILYCGEGALKGKVDEVRLYDRALSAAEMKALASNIAVTSTIDLKSSLAARWAFDGGGTGTAADSSSNANHGKLNGGTWTKGKFDGALEFDGKTNCVSVPDAASLNFNSGFTLSAWIKVPSEGALGENRTILQKGEHYGLTLVNDHTLRFAVGPGAAMDASITLSDWHLVAATYDGTTARIYVNGALAAEKALQPLTSSQKSDLCIGASTRGATNGFRGVIDEVRLYSRALNAQEIEALGKATPAKEQK